MGKLKVKYFIKQSSICLIMSLMLCLINISHQEKSNAKLEKNEIKAKAEIKSKTEVKSENAAKLEAKTQCKAKSLISTLLELHATSKAVTENETDRRRWKRGKRNKRKPRKNNRKNKRKSRRNNRGGFKFPRGYVMIKGRGNFCIKTARNKRVIQSRCTKKNNVLWRFIKFAGRYIIQNKNGYVLDNYAFKKNNGGPIYAKKRNNQNNQKWSIINLGGGKFEIKGDHSGKCLDNTGKARAGVGYHQWDCNDGNKNQHFRIVKVVKRKKVNLPSGYVQIKGKGNLCIHAAARYKRVKQGPCNSSRNALWKFAKQGDAFIIQNKGGMVLHLKKSNRNGVHLKMNQ